MITIHHRAYFLFALVILAAVWLSAHPAAAEEYATFKAFYKDSGLLSWGKLLLGGVIALGAGAVVFFTGGAATPLAAAVGSWIGGMMGLSGAAAVNAGLALLGGGAVASGGFGMAGGAAVLATIFTFSTEVLIDVAAESLFNTYDYEDLQEKSEKLLTLPLPVNTSGSEAYQQAMAVLEDVNKDLPLAAPENQSIIDRAISTLWAELWAEMTFEDDAETAKDYTMLALLHFVKNDYRYAKSYSERAIQKARAAEIQHTLPDFIHAASSIYDENDNIYHVPVDQLRSSLLNEANNTLLWSKPTPLTPLLFAIFTDRVILRYGDDSLLPGVFRDIYAIMQHDDLEKFRQADYTLMLARYLTVIKRDQQRVLAITKSVNDTILNDPEYLQLADEALSRYLVLVRDAKRVSRDLLFLMDDGDEEMANVQKMDSLLDRYSSYNEVARLEDAVCSMAEKQGTYLPRCG